MAPAPWYVQGWGFQPRPLADGGSLLTLHLLEGLSGSADTDGDASVTSIEIAAYLEEKVNKAARAAYHQRQQPVVSGDDRVLVNW